MLTNHQKTPVYFDAEIVDENIQPVDGEQYDSEQVQQAIAETDSSITITQGIAQGAFLAGLQITSTQYLYLAGSVGLFPAVIAGLPVGASLAATLCYLRFHHSIIPQISDRQKFGIGVIRSATLAASSWKLTGDAQDMDTIARNSFSTVTEQVKVYEGIEKPKETNYGLFLGLAAVVSVLLYFYWRKK
ncbi:hypothetical protein HGR01_40155 (plasmid) [Tolypothrix sp. PCC 7712]|uniref:hypothetical protein n=1 Tax=Tolypothrix sp. PCC 7712 TaxID=2596898 RepID=UPI0021F6E334|nr:hypothetical protein [Tolypothrix sp. PCC 7712]UYD31096.1 hypothetical protein HGR01_40155 [Tolypothrix sp. PCC 7712]